MSSIMRRRNGLIAWSVMGRLLSGGRVATPHLQTGRASYLSPPRASGGGALPRERFSPLTHGRRSRESTRPAGRPEEFKGITAPPHASLSNEIAHDGKATS